MSDLSLLFVCQLQCIEAGSLLMHNNEKRIYKTILFNMRKHCSVVDTYDVNLFWLGGGQMCPLVDFFK